LFVHTPGVCQERRPTLMAECGLSQDASPARPPSSCPRTASRTACGARPASAASQASWLASGCAAPRSWRGRSYSAPASRPAPPSPRCGFVALRALLGGAGEPHRVEPPRARRRRVPRLVLTPKRSIGHGGNPHGEVTGAREFLTDVEVEELAPRVIENFPPGAAQVLAGYGPSVWVLKILAKESRVPGRVTQRRESRPLPACVSPAVRSCSGTTRSGVAAREQ